MKTVLFVTQTLGHRSACGIGLIGKLLGESLVKSTQYAVEVLYTDNAAGLHQAIAEVEPDAIIYNYHSVTAPWMPQARATAPRRAAIEHILLHHDVHQQVVDDFKAGQNFGGFDMLVTADPTLRPNDRVCLVNRLAPPHVPAPYQDQGLPIIGFQGFGPRHKGIHRIVDQVKMEFEEAIIRLHIPFSFYGDPHGVEAANRVREAHAAIAHCPGLRIEASHDLLSTEQVIEFLGQNTINCYFYDYLDGAGLASSPDYALAAKRPIAVTKSHQLRNYRNLHPSICIEDRSLRDIIASGLEPLHELHAASTETRVVQDYEAMLDQVFSPAAQRARALSLPTRNLWAPQHLQFIMDGPPWVAAWDAEQRLLEWSRQLLTPGDVFLDVGAGYGAWALAYAAMAPVVAYEAQWAEFCKLCGGIALNRLEARVVAAHGDITALELDREILRLRERGPRIGLLRLNVEADVALAVLTGAQALITADQPCLLVHCQVTPDRRTLFDVVEHDLGYRIVPIRGYPDSWICVSRTREAAPDHLAAGM